MAYTLPVAGDLKSRFPEFADVANATVAPFINAASLWVDDSWSERDYPNAIIYLAAHYLQMYQKALLSTSSGGGGGGGSGSEEITTFVSEIKFEDFDIKFGSGGKSSSSTTGGGGAVSSSAALLAMTPYGMLYEQLRDRNVFPFAIV